MSEEKYADVLEDTTHTVWAFGMNLPEQPEGDGGDYRPPAEAYLDQIQLAKGLLAVALQTALSEIPDNVRRKGQYLARSTINVVEELSTQEPEVRRLWAVKSAYDLVAHLYDALYEEGRPSPRVTLPKLARTRRHQ